MARDLQPILGYLTWENFAGGIKRAIVSCEKGEQDPNDHFHETTKMVEIGSGAMRSVADWFLTRYACYLLAMNGDSSIAEIADAQRYFAIQTRLRELDEALTDEERRGMLRDRVSEGTLDLNSAAKDAGVLEYGLFHHKGYEGLYGMGLSEIKKRKGLSKKESLYDRSGSEELAANEFRITQTASSLRKNKISGEAAAQNEHFRIGRKVRNAIVEIGNVPPENLPPEPDITKIGANKPKELRDKAPPES
jgi:DNA-damage-inducible protein D